MPTSKVLSPWFIAMIGIVVLVAHLAVSFEYSNWYWGFNHYFFLPSAWTFAAIALGCVLCLPWVWSGILRVHRRVRQQAGTLSVDTRVVDAVVTGLACIGFWFLRTPTHFLGDGRLLIRLLHQDIWMHAHEPLDRLVHYGVYRLTRPVLGWDGEMVYAVLSVGAGVIYVLAALRLGALLGRKLFVTGFLLMLGSVQLFLGYAESYSLATAAILVYMVLSLEYCEGRRRLVWPAVVLATGMALHNAVGFLVPSFLYLWLWGGSGRARWSVGRVLLGVAYLGLFAVPVVATMGRWDTGEMSLLFVPLSGHRIAQYTMFSWEHLVDFANEQILISPLVWMVALAFAVRFWRDASVRASVRFRFLVVAGLFPLVFNFILRPGLGGSRDWDLWSMGCLPYAVAVLCWIVSWLERRQVGYAAWVLVVVGFFHIAPWVVVNGSGALGFERFDRMLTDNPLWTDKRIAAGHELLAAHHMEQAALEDAARHLEQAAALVPRKARYWGDLGSTYLLLGRLDAAEKPLLRAARLDRKDPRPHTGLGELYLRQGRLTEAEAALRRAIEIDAERGLPYFYLGMVYRAQDMAEKAVEAYRQATELAPSVSIYAHHLAMGLEEIPGRDEEAIEAWRRVALLAGRDPALQGLLQEALEHIQRLNQHGRDPAQ
jgi:Flp pilus assembly protein TadD